MNHQISPTQFPFSYGFPMAIRPYYLPSNHPMTSRQRSCSNSHEHGTPLGMLHFQGIPESIEPRKPPQRSWAWHSTGRWVWCGAGVFGSKTRQNGGMRKKLEYGLKLLFMLDFNAGSNYGTVWWCFVSGFLVLALDFRDHGSKKPKCQRIAIAGGTLTVGGPSTPRNRGESPCWFQWRINRKVDYCIYSKCIVGPWLIYMDNITTNENGI